jgi:hypothetical protein
MKIVFEAELGESALKVIRNPECDVVILNLTHVVSFGGRTPFLFMLALQLAIEQMLLPRPSLAATMAGCPTTARSD